MNWSKSKNTNGSRNKGNRIIEKIANMAWTWKPNHWKDGIFFVFHFSGWDSERSTRQAKQALWEYIDERRRRHVKQWTIEFEVHLTHSKQVPFIDDPIFFWSYDAEPSLSPPGVPQSLLRLSSMYSHISAHESHPEKWRTKHIPAFQSALRIRSFIV